MNISEHQINKFDLYLNNQMSSAERDAFEKTLLENKKLNSIFESYKTGLYAIKTQSFHDESKAFIISKRKRTRNLQVLRVISIAAAIALIAVFSSRILLNQNSNRYEVFQNAFTPFPDITAMRNDNDNSLSKAMQAYSIGRYELAIEIFDKKPDSDTSSFYRGISFLALEIPEKAISNLSAISKTSIFYEESIWYLSLAYFLNDECIMMKDNLNTLHFNETRDQKAKLLLEYCSRNDL
jgi:hypothetical protein